MTVVLEACDYSWARPTLDALWNAGVRVVFRYLGPASWGKTITQAEYGRLIARGFEVRLVFEDTTHDASGGSAAGVANAKFALLYVPTGYPSTGPIYMAVDESVSGQSLAVAVSYIAGASSVLGVARTGDYGDGLLIEATKAAGVAEHHWLAGAKAWPGYSTAAPTVEVLQGGAGPLATTDADTVHETPTPEETTVPAATTVVGYFPAPGGGYFELHANGGLYAYTGAVPSEFEYTAVTSTTGQHYTFGPTVTPEVISYLGLPAADQNVPFPTRRFVALVAIAYNGVPVGQGSPGAAGPPGAPGAPGKLIATGPIKVTIAGQLKAT